LLPALGAAQWKQVMAEGNGPMYEKILVAIDESEAAERVLAAAQELASLSDGEICILHLREREPSKFMTPPSETTGEAQATVDAAVKGLAGAGIKAAGIVRDAVFGYAAREIVTEAKTRGAGVIVMGSHGRGDLAGLLVGSTVHKVLHLAHVPVLVVR
jgi:nucleotide-binding universal stress UspA family protein